MFGSNSGSSIFGQQPAFGGFGAQTQSSPFGSTVAQSQPSFGSNLFGSSSSQPSFGANQSFGSSSTPSFGATSTPAFGSTATSTFGTSTFGSGGAFGTSNTPPFGSSNTPAFGSSNAPSFGATSNPSFGVSSTQAFGMGSTPAFGTSNSPGFGAGSTPAFGAGSAPAFGVGSSPSFNFGSAPTFGQPSSPFGSTTSFGAQSSAFGSQTAAPASNSGFGQSLSGAQQGGSRIAPYTATPEADGGTQTPAKLESISAMPVYKEKSHEELRWEDYQRGDKGGPNPAGPPTLGIGFGTSSAQSSPFASSSTFGQASSNLFSAPASSTPFSTPPSSNPFSSPASSIQFSTPASSNQFSNPFSTPAASSNPFGSKPSTFGSTVVGTSTSAFGSSGFGTSTTANPFGASSTSTTSLFTAPSTSAFNSNTSASLFGAQSSSAFGSASAQGTNPTFGSGLSFTNTSAQPFQSTTPSFGQTGGALGQSTSSFGQSSAGQSTLFNAPSFGGGLFSSSSSQLSTGNPVGFGQTTPSLSTPFPSTQSAQTNSAFGFGNFNQTQPSIGAFGGGSNMFGQTPAQVSATPSPAVIQSVQNPFGVLPPVPQMSTARAGTAPSIQYGISSMPAVDKPVPIRISSILTSRHLSQRRIKLPARKYHPKSDGLKVPFFSEDENMSSTPKADAVFIPRENPRALMIQTKDRLPPKAHSNKSSALNGINHSRHENGKILHEESNHMPNGSKASYYQRAATDEEFSKEQTHPSKASQYSNGNHTDHQNHKGDSYISLTSHRAGEAAIVYEHGADIEALMPKLRLSDYYTEPRIQELAAKERAEPGFCQCVNNFVVGRHGYGSIKFLGQTDVRRLDLQSLIQFNNREVIVYLDDTKKPPVGQGLNKPAEVTLLNIKCYDKKTGEQYTERPKIEKYKEMLRRKAEIQGAEFLSYEPVKGEWKFKVSHFSSYKFDDEDQ